MTTGASDTVTGPAAMGAIGAAHPLTLRITLEAGNTLGPGKIRLLELIGEHGSISAAGRAMGMSYRRAWLLADVLNASFTAPLIVKQTGGANGGGAALTAFGHEVIKRYRSIEQAALASAADDLAVLRVTARALAKTEA